MPLRRPTLATILIAINLVCALVTMATVPSQATAQERRIDTQHGTVTVETVVDGLTHPWGMDFLPDGRILVTERPGRMRIVDPRDRTLSPPLAGVPEVFNRGPGRLAGCARRSQL